MFIFSVYGLFSVVSLRTGDGKPGNPIDPLKIMVRARTRHHLDSLKRAFPQELGNAKIIESQNSDYRVRLTLDKSVWSSVLVALNDEIHYDRVKPAMHEAGCDGRRDDGPLNYDALVMSAFMEGQRAQDRLYPPVGRVNYAD